MRRDRTNVARSYIHTYGAYVRIGLPANVSALIREQTGAYIRRRVGVYTYT